jgi:hypothetical protein
VAAAVTTPVVQSDAAAPAFTLVEALQNSR